MQFFRRTAAKTAAWLACIAVAIGTATPAYANVKMPEAPPWGACGLMTSETKVVRTFSTGYKLLCGGPRWSPNPASGYRHIIGKHKGEFQTLAATLATGRNWRDLADFSIEWTLKDPDRVSNGGAGKVCQSRTLYLANNNGRVVLTRTFRVITATSSRSIITAYPGAPC